MRRRHWAVGAASGPDEWRKGKPADWIKGIPCDREGFVYQALPRLSCGSEVTHQVDRLPGAYVTKAEEIVDEQFAKTGYRLAELLNGAFSN